MRAKRKVEAQLVYPPERNPVRETVRSTAAPRVFPKRSSWDPYEVWRTRVKRSAGSVT
jgi:hypothetical protein